ncbi:MAG: hypothetical protein LBL31_08020 [Spirochaetaceae bacterium]|jgi:hypothetical protein|nr:hypothetical protein [Spirochaetaceae bacterium]
MDMIDQITAILPLVPQMVQTGKSVWSIVKPLLSGLGVELSHDDEKKVIELEQSKDINGLIEMLKNIEKVANQNAVNQNYTGDLGAQVGVNYGTINLTTTGKKSSSVKISDEALQILSEMAEDPTGTLTAIMMLGGYMFQTNHKNFGTERNDPREVALLNGIIDELEQYGLIKANSPKREMFSITRDGFNVADKLQKK